jgi:hypothetical protein
MLWKESRYTIWSSVIATKMLIKISFSYNIRGWCQSEKSSFGLRWRGILSITPYSPWCRLQSSLWWNFWLLSRIHRSVALPSMHEWMESVASSCCMAFVTERLHGRDAKKPAREGHWMTSSSQLKIWSSCSGYENYRPVLSVQASRPWLTQMSMVVHVYRCSNWEHCHHACHEAVKQASSRDGQLSWNRATAVRRSPV